MAVLNTKDLILTLVDDKLAGDISDLNHYIGWRPDMGVQVVSHWTGETVFFVLDRVEKDNEGDVKYWVFRPKYTNKINPKFKDLALLLFND